MMQNDLIHIWIYQQRKKCAVARATELHFSRRCRRNKSALPLLWHSVEQTYSNVKCLYLYRRSWTRTSCWVTWPPDRYRMTRELLVSMKRWPTYRLHYAQSIQYRVAQKLAHFIRLITSSNIDQFSNFFHSHNQDKIWNSRPTITNDPTTPQVCRYTTLWNVSVAKATTENKTTSVTTQECVVQQQYGHIEH